MRLFVLFLFLLPIVWSALVPKFRPPSVPLLLHDPYFQYWSNGDNLYDSFPTLWTGQIKALVGMIRIDGTTYRFMGPNNIAGSPNAIPQTQLQVYPTTTLYTFANSQVELIVEFMNPLLTDNYVQFSSPISYTTFRVRSKDSKSHQIQLYFDMTGETAVNEVSEQIVWNRVNMTSNSVQGMRVGTKEQAVLQKSGDFVGINWGYGYIVTENSKDVSSTMNTDVLSRGTFVKSGTLPTTDDLRMPRACSDNWIVLAYTWNFVVNANGAEISKVVLLGYDDISSIDYFGQTMKGLWRQSFSSIEALLVYSWQNYAFTRKRCQTFDLQIVNKLTSEGGDEYATMASLSYRQALAGMKLVWNDKKQLPWYFLKEISSDGDLSTVDVIFPASPILLFLKPELVMLQLLPILSYANNETSNPYPYPFTPHHLGYYPIANIKPDEQENMPIEETANMMMMIAACGYKDVSLLQKHIVGNNYLDLLAKWTGYLIANLPDPEDQLCTDDFEGKSPHNVNLAAKGIVGIASFGKICELLGKSDLAQQYYTVAKTYADYWVRNALDSDQSHFKLQYNLTNTFSLKYNLLYQYVLKLNIFPDTVIQQDIQYYITKQLNTYGVPLDNRATFTKLDWLYWIASMGNKDQFQQLNHAAFRFANETKNRVPLTDWYETTDASLKGFIARPVVGGIWAKMLLASALDG